MVQDPAGDPPPRLLHFCKCAIPVALAVRWTAYERCPNRNAHISYRTQSSHLSVRHIKELRDSLSVKPALVTLRHKQLLALQHHRSTPQVRAVAKLLSLKELLHRVPVSEIDPLRLTSVVQIKLGEAHLFGIVRRAGDPVLGCLTATNEGAPGLDLWRPGATAYLPTSSRKRISDSIPSSKFFRWNFSFGAWILSSGRPKPIITLGRPDCGQSRPQWGWNRRNE